MRVGLLRNKHILYNIRPDLFDQMQWCDFLGEWIPQDSIFQYIN